jgi:hypothetical protein
MTHENLQSGQQLPTQANKKQQNAREKHQLHGWMPIVVQLGQSDRGEYRAPGFEREVCN